MKLLKLNRVTKDIGIFGKKGTFKTTVVVLYGFLEKILFNTEIYSNIKNLGFNYTYVKNLEDLNEIFTNYNRKLFIGDDFERWFFSRNWQRNTALNDLLLDWGKYYCSIIYDAKREHAIDIGLRDATSEFWYNEPYLFIKSNTGNIKLDRINNNILKKYANFINIRIKRFNENLEPITQDLIIKNLPYIMKLFDTHETINPISLEDN